MGVATKGKVERRVTTNTFKYCMEISQIICKRNIHHFSKYENNYITIMLL